MAEKILSTSPLGKEEMPNSQQAEQAVLGCALLKPDSLSYMMAELVPDDFFYNDHKLIFETVEHLFSDNKPVDLISVTDDLEKRGMIDKVGGVAAISSLSDSIPYLHNDHFYVDMVKEKSRLRSLIKTFVDLIGACYKEEAGLRQIVDVAAERLYTIREGEGDRGFSSLGKVLADKLTELDRLAKTEESPSIRSGFASLDQIIGGLRKGSLLILAARPGMGKSALAFNIVQRVSMNSKEPVPAAIFSLEMSKAEVSTRFLATRLSIDSRKLSDGRLSDQEWEDIGQAFPKIYEAPIYIDDRSGISPLEMLSRCRELRLKEPKLGLVVVDYLQLMSSSRTRQDNRQQEISDISRNLKIMARELDLPVIALSQLSRACEARSNKRPMLSDLRDSGAIEQDADVVMFLYREDYYKELEDNEGREESSAGDTGVELAELIIAKNRHGATKTIELGWQPEFTRFSELEDERPLPEAPPF